MHSPRRGSFHRSLTVLFAIGHCVYLALGSGLPSFRPDCACPALLRCQSQAPPPSEPGSHGLWRRLPIALRWSCGRPGGGQQPAPSGPSTPAAQRLPACHAAGLGFPRFARHYYGDSLASSGYIRCFSSPGSLLPIGRSSSADDGVAPFGDRAIIGCTRLPHAFRSVATSFLGTQRQGIHRVLILSSRSVPLAGSCRRDRGGRITRPSRVSFRFVCCNLSRYSAPTFVGTQGLHP